MANPRSATPLYSGLSAVVNSSFIFLSRQSFPNFPSSVSSPSSSDLTTTTSDGVPSTLRSARKLSKALAASYLWKTKYIQAWREKPSLFIIGYSLPLIDATWFLPPRSTKTRNNRLAARSCVFEGIGTLMSFAVKQPLQSRSSPLRVTPICLAVLRRAPLWAWA